LQPSSVIDAPPSKYMPASTNLMWNLSASQPAADRADDGAEVQHQHEGQGRAQAEAGAGHQLWSAMS